MLHEQERRPHVDGEDAVPELDRGVVERAAAAEPRGVDEPVEPPEALLARPHDGDRRLGQREVGLGERRLAAELLQLLAHRLAAFPPAAADDDARGAQLRGAAGDRGAEPLGAAGDDQHLPVEPQPGERIAHDVSTSSMRTGRRSRSDRQAAMPMTSGARASAVVTGGVSPAPSAATNASHSRT